MGYDPRDPRDERLKEAASNCHDLIRTYMLEDNIPEKVRLAYAIRLLASKRMPTPIRVFGSKFDAEKNGEYLEDGLILAARLNEIGKHEQENDKKNAITPNSNLESRPKSNSKKTNKLTIPKNENAG